MVRTRADPSLRRLRSWPAWEIERAVVAEAGLADAAWPSRMPADGVSFPPVWRGPRSADHRTLRSFGGMCLWSTAPQRWPFRSLQGRVGGAARGFPGLDEAVPAWDRMTASLAARGGGAARPPGGGPDGPLFWRPLPPLGGPWAVPGLPLERINIHSLQLATCKCGQGNRCLGFEGKGAAGPRPAP